MSEEPTLPCVALNDSERKISIEFNMIELMTDEEFILTSKAFVQEFHKNAHGELQPTLIAL